MGKLIDEAVLNYVSSIPGAMQKYKNSIVKQGKSNKKYLAKVTIDYGINMLHSGLSDEITPKIVEELFREQAAICNSLADYCKEFLIKE